MSLLRDGDYGGALSDMQAFCRRVGEARPLWLSRDVDVGCVETHLERAARRGRTLRQSITRAGMPDQAENADRRIASMCERCGIEPDSSGFPPEAVLGPAFTPVRGGACDQFLSARFTGLLLPTKEEPRERG